jgi:hypothetical protein
MAEEDIPMTDIVERLRAKGATLIASRLLRSEVPKSSFVFSGIDDPSIKICWALSNLRPMWKTDNHKKSNKRTHLL